MFMNYLQINFSHVMLNLFILVCLHVLTLFQGQAQNSDDNVGDDYPVKALENKYLKVTVFLPDAEKGYYRGTRFDWSGIIGQVEYGGHTFFKDSEITEGEIIAFVHDPFNPDAGTGTVEEFRDPLGYDDGGAGTPFLKIGVGILERTDDKPYHWSTHYKVIDPGKWTVRAKADRITFFQSISTGFGYGYEYEKTIRLSADSPELIIVHTLKNTGKRSIRGNPYCHNFFTLDRQTVGADYVLELPNPVSPIDDYGTSVNWGEKQLWPTRVLTDGEWIGGHLDPSASRSYTLLNKKTKTSVEVISDVDPGPFYIIMFRHSFSVEPMVLFEIKPGDSFSWNRTYKFNIP
jgi:hypothetical protein